MRCARCVLHRLVCGLPALRVLRGHAHRTFGLHRTRNLPHFHSAAAPHCAHCTSPRSHLSRSYSRARAFPSHARAHRRTLPRAARYAAPVAAARTATACVSRASTPTTHFSRAIRAVRRAPRLRTRTACLPPLFSLRAVARTLPRYCKLPLFTRAAGHGKNAQRQRLARRH